MRSFDKQNVPFRPFVFLAQLSLVLCWLPADYETRTARNKQDLLWQQILWEPYERLPTEGPGGTALLNLLRPSFLRGVFERENDEGFEWGLKLIHTYGVCAKARIDILSDSPYTGLFKTGAVGIIRPNTAAFNEDNLLPSFAFKALIDYNPSINFHTLYSPNGQGLNQNWFANNVSNVIEAPTSTAGQVGLKAFELTLSMLDGDRPEDASTMGLYEQAARHTNGVPVYRTVVAPWRVDFVPNKALKQSEYDFTDFRSKLARLPAGTTLYSLVAYAYKADAEVKRNGRLIGHVVTESELVATKYCDQRLFFKHTLKPWAPY